MKKQYTCPMHSEVTTDEAGTCPKCGMDLVPVTEAQEDEKQSGQEQKTQKMSCSCC